MIEITIEKYDDQKKIIFIEKDGASIWGIMSLMQYEDEMEYYGIGVERKECNGRKGYVFGNDIDVQLLRLETRRFIEDHNLEEMNCF